MKILIIEDDKKITSFLKKGLEEEGFIITIAEDGEDGSYLAINYDFDIILLDWMLPKKDGLKVLQEIRKNNNVSTPIIFLTAKSKIDDKVEGLNQGADDYLVKPFSFNELLARVKALIRRSLSALDNILKIKDLEINLDKKEVKKDSKTLKLNNKEYELLLFMIKNKNKFVSNNMIEESLWYDVGYINSNVIAVTMYNLRKKIGKDLIKNSRNIGYILEI